MPSQRLLDEVRAVMRTLHYSIHTERSYCDWVRRFVLFHKLQSRDELLPFALGKRYPNAVTVDAVLLVDLFAVDVPDAPAHPVLIENPLHSAANSEMLGNRLHAVRTLPIGVRYSLIALGVMFCKSR